MLDMVLDVTFDHVNQISLDISFDPLGLKTKAFDHLQNVIT